MNTCKAIVKHGVSLVTGNPPSSTHTGYLHTFRTSVTPSSASSSPKFCMRSLAKSFPHFSARKAPPSSLHLQWQRFGHWEGHPQGLRDTFGTSLVISMTPSNIVGDTPSASCLQGGGEEQGSKFDVSSNCVTPVFRVSPFFQQASDVENKKVRILFLSEGNVCRSVYAEAIFSSLIEENGLQDFVECASKASRDYNVGESPDPRAVQVAEELRLKLPEGAVARVFDCSSDIVLSDLLVVMDKFNASDVLKEVTVYEAIDKEGRYSYKVRRLSEFCRTKMIEDIDDPLYGNMGGPEELELLREVYNDIRDSCVGLMQTILDIKAALQGSETLKQGIAKSLGEMESLDWLVPPMLQKAETLFN